MIFNKEVGNTHILTLKQSFCVSYLWYKKRLFKLSSYYIEGEKMKKLQKLLPLIILFAILLTSCSKATPVPYEDLTFTKEESSDFVGSYSLGRVNYGQKSPEWGEWTKLEFAFKSTIVCFGGFDPTTNAVFRAAEGYQWSEVKFQGKLCLKLQKEQ
jgi:hypothetical protein